jgi:DsbC/DsbD-like thiol-disulfide interchange protein
MTARITLILASICTVSLAGVRSGKAEAEWWSSSKTYTAGAPVQTAFRLALDTGWHTYWLNPGDGGMKISVTWELPAGWTADELEHPVPKRFKTGELAGFGYEGTVIFPVKLTPPAGISGPAKLKGKISWLTCNDDQCLPGKAELELTLDAGAPAATDEAKAIDHALKKIPRPSNETSLTVIEQPETLVLTLHPLTPRPFGITDYEIFPATPQVINPAARIEFFKSGDSWSAEVPKSEYATQPIEKLALVLAGKSGQPPLTVCWQKNQGPAISESPEPMKRP